MRAVKARLWRASEFIIRSRDFCRVANDDEFRKVSSALYCPANLELVQLAAMIDACLRSPRDAVINLNQRYKAAFTSRYLRILTNLLFRAIGVTCIHAGSFLSSENVDNLGESSIPRHAQYKSSNNKLLFSRIIYLAVWLVRFRIICKYIRSFSYLQNYLWKGL